MLWMLIRHLMMNVASSSVTIAGAVVDDTQHLWIALDEGYWVWADIAGYLEPIEGPAGPVTPPRRVVRQGPDVYISDRVRLPLSLLRDSNEAALEQGIQIRAVRRSPVSWYRPLRLTGAVQRANGSTMARQVAAALTVSHTELVLAAQAHEIPLPVLTRRLADLCALMEKRGLGPGTVMQNRWPIGIKHPDLTTPWQALVNGQIGLVEQVFIRSHASAYGGSGVGLKQ